MSHREREVRGQSWVILIVCVSDGKNATKGKSEQRGKGKEDYSDGLGDESQPP